MSGRTRANISDFSVMAYNRANILHKILDIQRIVLEQKKKGVSQEWVYLNLIYPAYRISRTTFYTYLGCNAKAEIKKLAHRRHPTLFDPDTPEDASTPAE